MDQITHTAVLSKLMQTNLSHLSDVELLEELTRLARSGREGGTLLITHLGEMNERRLSLGLGFPSLFVYCIEVLHLSEHEAYHRILAARTAKRFPRVLEMLGDGSLTLTTVRLLAGHLTDDNHAELLAAAAHRTRRQVEVLVAGRFPRPDTPSLIRKLPAAPRPRLVVPTNAPAPVPTNAPANTPTKPLPAPVPVAAPRPMVTPLSADGYLIRFTARARTYEKLSDAKELLRHAVPTGDLDEIFDRALTALLADLARKKFAATDRSRACTTRPGPSSPLRCPNEEDGPAMAGRDAARAGERRLGGTFPAAHPP
jgi:hypothetical protein